MTKEAAIELLKDRKVYVNGRSKEIQEKLFELGWKWQGDPADTTVVKYETSPFLFICNSGYLGYSKDMLIFIRDTFTEISAEEILAIELIRIPEKHEGWVNLYKTKEKAIAAAKIYESKEDAERCCGTNIRYLGAIKVEWEE